MNRVTDHIEALQARFAEHPYFGFVSDPALSFAARRQTVEDMAFYILFFADLSRMLLRDDASDDPLQAQINAHTREDDSHWRWYLGDLQRLGADPVGSRCGFLEELFDPATAGVRRLCYRLTALVIDASAPDRHAVLRAVEATGNIGFGYFGRLAREHRARGGESLVFFGEAHREVENESEAHAELEHATDELYPDVDRAIALVDQTFAAFTGFVDHLYARGRAGLEAA